MRIPAAHDFVFDLDGFVLEDGGPKFFEKTRQSIVAVEPDSDHPPLPNDSGRVYWLMSYSEFVAHASEAWTFCKYNGHEDMIDRARTPRFAQDGFQTLEASSDRYAAALMCTTAEAVGFGDVHLPSPSMVFRIPPGLVDAEYAWFSFCFGDARLEVRGSSEKKTFFMRSDTIDDLLFSALEESDVKSLSLGDQPKFGSKYDLDQGFFKLRDASKQEVRTFILVRRYVAGLIIAYQSKSNWTYEGLRLSQAKKLRGIDPEHRFFVLGQKVRADVREGVRHYVNGSRHNSPSFHFVVRGHYRNQACGPKHSQRRIVWIEPYWKNAEEWDAPVAARTTLL